MFRAPRLLILAAALVLTGAATAGAQPSNSMPSVAELRVYAQAMTPETRALVAPVTEAAARVKAEQAKLSPPTNDTERLLRLGALDQAPRRAMSQLQLSKLPQDQRKAGSSAVGVALAEVSEETLPELLKIIPAEGWFRQSVVGKEAAAAAFRIVQHADAGIQRRFLPALKRLADEGEVEPEQYAAMFDRLALAEGRPQRYGSQMRCEGGKWTPSPIEAPSDVDVRRRALKLEPMAEHLKDFAQMSC